MLKTNSLKRLKRQAAVSLMAGLLLGFTWGQAAVAASPSLDAPLRDTLAALPTLRNEKLVSSDLENKVVVVAFFASWCPPCNPEFDHLEAVRKKFAHQPVEVLAVNIFESFAGSGSDARLKAFLDRKNPGFVTIGNGESVSEAFGSVKRIPSVFLFDKNGDLAFNFIHEEGARKTHIEADELEKEIKELL